MSEDKQTNKFKVVALPDDVKPIAQIYINGERVHDVKIVEIFFQYLNFYYGWREPDGFEGMAFRPPGGGGSVYLVVSETPEGEPIFLLLLEMRYNMGGPRWCAPGGGMFEEAGTHCSIGKKNLLNKVGLVAGVDITVEPLPGPHLNKDRLFEIVDPFVTEEGVHCYWGKIPFSMLKKVEGGWTFDEGTAPAELVRSGKSLGMMFYTYLNFVRNTGDVTALCLAAKYVAMKFQTGGIQWVKK